MSKCKKCNFMMVQYPTLAEPGSGGASCLQGKWSDYAPPDTEEFDNCAQFRARAIFQMATDNEKGLPWIVSETNERDCPDCEKSADIIF